VLRSEYPATQGRPPRGAVAFTISRPFTLTRGVGIVLNDPAMRGGFGRWASAIALCASMSLGTAARATIYGGGGSSRTDCLLVFDAPVNDPEGRPKRVRCTDGDTNCDGDGVVNGQCLIAVGVCGNSTSDPLRCTSNGLTSAEV